MSTLYLIRHGITAENLEHRMQGSTDAPLCPLGLEQLPYLGEHFRTIPLEAVYCSGFQRALQTAQAVADSQGLTPIIRPELRERAAGDYEGWTVSDLLGMVGIERQQGGPRYPVQFEFPTAEPVPEVYARMAGVLNEIMDAHPDGAVAVVSHGMALQMAFAYLMDIPLERYTSYALPNASVSKFVTDTAHRGVMAYFGDISFLPDSFLSVSKSIERK